MELDRSSTPDAKMSSVWTKGLQVPPAAMTLSEDTGRELLDMGFDNQFSGSDTESQGHKSKNKHVGLN